MKTVLVILLLALTGCASLPGGTAQDIRQFARADVEAALSIARAHQDSRGEACFVALLGAMPEDAPESIAPTGLVSVYEQGRVIRLGLQAGLPDTVVDACAPMLLDSQRAILRAISVVGAP